MQTPNTNALPTGLMPGLPSALSAGIEQALPTVDEPDLKKEILQRIGEQVKQLIMSARRDAESKVKANLKELHDSINDMDSRLDALMSQLDELETPHKQAVEQHAVAQALAKVEQQWGKELGKLKQELHQTIFAHNHNADLMKHQKDALDSLRSELQSQKGAANSERLKLAKAQLTKIDGLMKHQQKHKNLQPLFQRLQNLEHRLAASRASWPMGMMPPMAGMMPPQMPMPGMQPPGLQAAAAASAASGRAANAKGGRNAKGGQAAAAAPAASADKAAPRVPTDEEVQSRLAKVALKTAEGKQEAAGDEEDADDEEAGDAEEATEEPNASKEAPAVVESVPEDAS